MKCDQPIIFWEEKAEGRKGQKKRRNETESGKLSSFLFHESRLHSGVDCVCNSARTPSRQLPTTYTESPTADTVRRTCTWDERWDAKIFFAFLLFYFTKVFTKIRKPCNFEEEKIQFSAITKMRLLIGWFYFCYALIG